MGTALIKIRLSVCSISLFFIKGLRLPLGVKPNTSAARLSDLPLGFREQKGAQIFSPVCPADCKPSEQVSPFLLILIKAAYCCGKSVAEQDQVDSVSVNLIKFLLKSLFPHKDFFSDLNGLFGQGIINSDFCFHIAHLPLFPILFCMVFQAALYAPGHPHSRSPAKV